MFKHEIKLIETAEKLVIEVQKVTSALFNKTRECQELKTALAASQDVQTNLEQEIKLLKGILKVYKKQEPIQS